MKSPQVIVLGSINTDLVLRGPRLPRPGETVLGGEFYQAGGGKGANQAVAAARAAQAPVLFIAAVGDDLFGRDSLARLANENLDVRFIKTVPAEPSGVALILVDREGENMIGVASGANMCLAPADIDRVPRNCLAQQEFFWPAWKLLWQRSLMDSSRAKRSGLRTILNPAPALLDILTGDLFQQVDMLTPNEVEATMLSGVEVAINEKIDIDRAIAAARVLQQRGCGAVIVTLGAAGVVVVEKEATHIAALPVTAMDATAAGDAFSGALSVALAEGLSLVDAARWASRAAALAVSRAGAQPSLATRDEIDRFSA